MRDHVFLFVVAAVTALLLWAGDAARHFLSLDIDAVANGEVWRLLTGHFVHLGPYHALLNILGLAVYLLLCPQVLDWREWSRRWLFLCLATGIALYLCLEDITRYSGLSGVIHGLFFLGLWPLARQKDPVAIAALAYLFGKLVWEQWAGVPVSDQAAIGGPVVTESHLFGTLAAVVYAVLFRKIRRGDRNT